MSPDDISRIFSRSVLLGLDQIVSPRLIKVAYPLGLVAIALWAISHFVFTFSLGFGEGVWGLIEIVVYGLLYVIGLRVACELLLVFFREHAHSARPMGATQAHSSLIDEVRDAIEDLATEDEDGAAEAARAASRPTPRPTPAAPPPAAVPAAAASRPAPKPRPRTAKRTSAALASGQNNATAASKGKPSGAGAAAPATAADKPQKPDA